jgi:predicted MPP superfamily phosphohydrolase
MFRRSPLFKTITGAISDLLGRLGLQIGLSPSSLRLEQVQISIPGLPAPLDGFRIGLLTDLHLGRTTPLPLVERAFALLRERRPNLVLLAGDLVSSPAGLAPLTELVATVAPVYAVTGNWDYWFAELRQIPGLHLLENEGAEVAPGLWLAGLADVQQGEPDLTRALAGAPPEAVRLLLVHEPDWADQLRPADRIALQLSGHSHGGQIRLPLLGPLILPPAGRKYHTGRYQTPATQVYTSRGVGAAHLPIRIGARPEVTEITLVKG